MKVKILFEADAKFTDESENFHEAGRRVLVKVENFHEAGGRGCR